MRVRQLIAKLGKVDPEARVVLWGVNEEHVLMTGVVVTEVAALYMYTDSGLKRLDPETKVVELT